MLRFFDPNKTQFHSLLAGCLKGLLDAREVVVKIAHARIAAVLGAGRGLQPDFLAGAERCVLAEENDGGRF